MRLFRKKTEAEKSREILKVSASPFAALKAAGWRFGVLLVVAILAEWILVPLLTAMACFAKASFTSMGSLVGSYIQNHLFDGWFFIQQFSQWQTPAMLFALVVLAAAVLAAASIYAQRFISNDVKNIFGPAASESNQKGSARLFANELLLKDINNTWDGDWNNPPENPGIVMGYSQSLKCFYLTPPETHHMIIGTPGSGKTTKFLYSSLGALCASGASCIITDPKGEIYNATSDALAAKGIDVYVIDFNKPERSMCFNPLQLIYDTYVEYSNEAEEWLSKASSLLKSKGITNLDKSENFAAWNDDYEAYEAYLDALRRAENAKSEAWSKADEHALDLAEALIPEQPGVPGEHWDTVARGLMRSILLLVGTYNGGSDFVAKSEGETPFRVPETYERTLETVHEILRVYGGNEETGKSNRALNDIMDRINPKHPAVKAYAQTKNSNEKEQSTIVSNTIKFLDNFLNDSLNKVLNKSDFELGAFGTKQSVLYIIMPDSRPAVGKLFSVIATQLYQALIAEATKIGKKLPVPVFFLLEELGNVKTPIPNLGNTLAMSRGYNIFYTLILQGFNQLPQWYGDTVFRQLLDTCSVKMLLQTEDAQECGKYFSESMGTYTYVNDRVTHNRKTMGLIDSSASTSQETGERPLMKPDEITKWNSDWGTLVLQSKPGKQPGWIAKNLFNYKHMQPCAYPCAFIWDTPLGKLMDIGDRDYEEQKSRMKQMENRLANRIPSTPWLPAASSAQEEVNVRKAARRSGMTSGMKDLLGDYLAIQDVRVATMFTVLGDLELDALKNGKEGFIDRYVDSFLKNNLKEYFKANDPENTNQRSRNRQKASVTNLLYTLLSELLLDNEVITKHFNEYKKLEDKTAQFNAIRVMLIDLGYSIKSIPEAVEVKAEEIKAEDAGQIEQIEKPQTSDEYDELIEEIALEEEGEIEELQTSDFEQLEELEDVEEITELVEEETASEIAFEDVQSDSGDQVIEDLDKSSMGTKVVVDMDAPIEEKTYNTSTETKIEADQKKAKNKSIELIRKATKAARANASTEKEYFKLLQEQKITIQLSAQGYLYKSPAFGNYISEKVISKSAMEANLENYFASKAKSQSDAHKTSENVVEEPQAEQVVTSSVQEETTPEKASELTQGEENKGMGHHVAMPEMVDGKVALPYDLTEKRLEELCRANIGRAANLQNLDSAMKAKNVTFLDAYLANKSFIYLGRNNKPRVNAKKLLKNLNDNFEIEA